MTALAETGEVGREPQEAWLVVATRNRPEQLRRLLLSLRWQTRPPDGVVVVDASDGPARAPTDPAGQPFALRYITRSKPSSAGQSNTGVERVPESADLIAFADDDSAFAPDAWGRMLEFWRRAPGSLGGAGFNMLNHPEQSSN